MEEVTYCCSMCTSAKGARLASCLATVVFSVTAAAYLYLALFYDVASLSSKEALLGYFHGSRGLAIAYAVIAAVGAVTSFMWFWAIHTGRRGWFIPFLIFWSVSCALQFTYIVLISISYSQLVSRDHAPDDGIKEIRKDFAVSLTWRMLLLALQLGFMFLLRSWWREMGRHQPHSCLHGCHDSAPATPDILCDSKPRLC